MFQSDFGRSEHVTYSLNRKIWNLKLMNIIHWDIKYVFCFSRLFLLYNLSLILYKWVRNCLKLCLARNIVFFNFSFSKLLKNFLNLYSFFILLLRIFRVIFEIFFKFYLEYNFWDIFYIILQNSRNSAIFSEESVVRISIAKLYDPTPG